MKLNNIGEVNFTYEDIINELDNFLKIYGKRPIKKNNGGMKSPHCFATFFLMKKLNKKYIIESGVLKGQSTWLIEQICPNSKLLCIDPNLNSRIYISKKAKYTKIDWKFLKLKNNDINKETLVFFDDHQNAFERIKYAKKNGYKYLIFEDNYPTGQGDCLSLKQVLDKNNEDSNFLRNNLEIYYEFPPVFKKEITRWGCLWDDNYPTKKPIFNILEGNEKYKIFYDDALNYTWICLVKLK